MTNCGKCHTCGGPISTVLDGEEWCKACQTYQRPWSHGWARGAGEDMSADPAWRQPVRLDLLAGIALWAFCSVLIGGWIWIALNHRKRR